VELTAGKHEFRLKVIGPNEASTSHMVGVDALMVK